MNEARAPTDEKIKEKVLKEYRSGIGPKALSEKMGISINTIKSWIKRDKAKGNGHIQGASDNKKDAPPKGKKGAPSGNKNAVGSGAPKGNKNAEIHGFFSKYLPPDTLTIIEDINSKDFLNILWESIQLSYAAILRAQRIMYVKDKEEMIKEIKKVKTKKNESERNTTKENEVEWEFQFSWDRQATFLAAQAKAMAELRSQIKQYEEMLHANWDSVTEEQKARIDKLKADTERIKTDNKGNGNEVVDDWIAGVMCEEPEDGDSS